MLRPLKITKCPKCGSRNLWVVSSHHYDYLCKDGCGMMDYVEVQNMTRRIIQRRKRARRG